MVQQLHSLEYTYLLKDGRVFHYTCNAPNNEILKLNGIKCIGEDFGCSNREILLIPSELLWLQGIPIPEDTSALTIYAENLLRRLK